MISINKAFKVKNIILKAVVLTLLLSLRYNNVVDNDLISVNDNFALKGAAFAYDTCAVKIKVSISFDSDIDGSKQVDGRDLALLMYYFGKTESEYKSESFKVSPDINGDKIVDGEDLVILAWRFGLKK